MKFTIVRSQPGRLRVRVGKYMFTKEQGQGISALLLAISGVKQVKLCETNGSILIVHSPSLQKATLFDTLKQLNPFHLPKGEMTTELVMEKQEKEFHGSLVKMVSWRYIRKWIFPSFLGPWFTWLGSIPYLIDGVKALGKGRATVELLDATAIGASLLTKDYTTASSTMFLLKLSELLLDYSNVRAKNQLTKSLAVKTQFVWLVEGEQEREIPMEDLRVNDVIRLRKGSMIPVDGHIMAGDGSVNEATMTGEPLPVHKKEGSSVFAGTLLEDGEIDVEVRSLGQDTRIAQIVDFIHSGEETKAEIQGKAEHLADNIVPVSFALFFGTFLFTGNLSRAMSVLMVDYSCAIKLTTPIAVISALKESSESGIVVKGGKYLELLSRVDTVVFDKTGTLTEAVPKVSKILSLHEDYDQDEVLTIAACLEEHFPHSIASSIVEEAKTSGLSHPEFHGKVEYIVAHGIVTNVDGLRYYIGSKHFIVDDEGIPLPEGKEDWIEEEIGSDSAVYLAIGQDVVGVICINDPPRPEAKAAIEALRQEGIEEIIMMTGDNENTARHVSQALGLDSYEAEVLPDGKAALITALKEQGKVVLMVGDGINDAPGLSCANVSMTLAGSSDIAREVADISILSHDLSDIVTARQVATALMSRISWHYSLIVGFNTALISLGVLGLLTAAQNALYHNISTLAFAARSTGKLLEKPKDKGE